MSRRGARGGEEVHGCDRGHQLQDWLGGHPAWLLCAPRPSSRRSCRLSRRETGDLRAYRNRGKADYNRDLSQRRADAVKTYFVTRGVASERLQSIGYGPTRPIANNKTQSGRATNRRTEFRLNQRQRQVASCFTTESTEATEPDRKEERVGGPVRTLPCFPTSVFSVLSVVKS